MTDIARFPYTGTTPGADANTYELFNTITVGGGSNLFPHCGVSKCVVFMKNSQAGVLNEYKSSDKGVTWNQISTTAVAAAAATGQNAYEFVVSPYRDWKLEWVNGGVAQATWELDMCLVDDRSASS